MSLEINETYINETEGYEFGESGWYETYHSSRGDLYESLRKEYGGCINTMYRDVPNPDSAHNPAPAVPIGLRRTHTSEKVGWVFSRTERYEDTQKPYTRQVWVEVREK